MEKRTKVNNKIFLDTTGARITNDAGDEKLFQIAEGGVKNNKNETTKEKALCMDVSMFVCPVFTSKRTYIHTSRHTYLHFVNWVFAIPQN